MSTSTTANVTASVAYSARTTGAATIGSVVESVLASQSTSYGFDFGVLASQISVAASASFSLVSATETIDLTAFPTATGNVVFTKIKLIYLTNDSIADGAQLWFGNAAANPFSAFMDTATTRLIIMPGSPLMICNFLLQAVNPWTVDATHKNIMIDSGSSTISGKLVVLGI